MPNIAATDVARSETIPIRRHPHPGEGRPRFAWPTFALGAGAMVVVVASAIATIGGSVPIWVTIPVNSAVVYAMFMVAHEGGLHYSLSTVRWINLTVGRLAWLFVVPMVSLSSFAYIHNQHHQNANDGDRDPDLFASHGPVWQLPFRWALMELFYAAWYCRHLKPRVRHSWRRPLLEIGEGAVMFSIYVGAIVAAIVTGHFWTLAVIVLIPQRIGIAFLAWWFIWLPHHDLEETQRQNRYRASRHRVGMERFLIPLMLAQNYHLVHHLHPWLPFYRYLQVWRRNEDAYLAHEPMVTTVFGTELTPDEVRQRK